MSVQRIITSLILVLLCTSLGAQVTIPKEKTSGGGSYSTRSSNSERAKMIGAKIDLNSLPVGYGRFSDDKLEEMEKAMKEREWSTEETAWGRAVALDNKDSYEKYIGMYPYGPHVGEARNRLIGIRVDDVFKASHGALPSLDRVLEDDESPTSTIIVENATDYPLTVMYSGEDSRVIVINPGSRGTVTLKNGSYKIAASVPVANIKPFAGKEELRGGRYETGYVVAPIYR